jgi:5'-AMP-activated protein kinase catalytic alpha subunit
MAPEIIKKKDYLGSQVDTWALGVILFRLLTGGYPFAAKTDRDLFNKICQGKVDLAMVSDLDAQACISDMLDLNPETRVTCQQVSAAHPAKNLCLPSQIL